MANSNDNGEQKPQAARLSTAIERLYAWWLVSTAVLLVFCLALTLYVHGASRGQRDAISALEARLGKLEASLATERPASPSMRAGERSMPTAPRVERPAPSPVTETPAPAPTAEPNVPPATQPAPARIDVPDEQGIALALASATREHDGVIEVVDATAVGALLGRLRDGGTRVTLETDTALRLAICARLVGRDGEAETLAPRLAADGPAQERYFEVSTRSLLARGRPRDALAVLDQWGRRSPDRPIALLLRALTEMTLGQTAAAELTMGRLHNAAQLDPQDRIAAATLLAMLEQWPRFETLVEGLADVPTELEPMRDLLGAILLWRTGRLVESLAALEFLAEHLRPVVGNATLSSAGSIQRPRRYDVDVWRGATLAAGGEWDAAREVLLRAAEFEPTRPEAYVELGRIEVQSGRADRARSYLQNALTQAPQNPAAWEVLAVLSVNEGQASRAIEEVSKAISAQPGRRSSLLLRAIAHAKLGEKDGVAADVRRLLAIDPTALDDVRAADALVRLFEPGELEALAAGDNAAEGANPAPKP